MNKNEKIRLVFVTIDSHENAKRLVLTLVKEKLIACGNIIPEINSIYTWKEKIEESKESLIIMKTSEVNTDKLIERINEIHPYEVPEIIFVKPNEVSDAYSNWVLNSCLR